MRRAAVGLLLVAILPPTAYSQPPHTRLADDKTLARTVDLFASTQADSGYFSGVVLIGHGDDVLLEKAYGLATRQPDRPNTTETRFDIASLGKMFTSVAVAQLVDRGLVKFDDPVGKHVRDLDNGDIAQKVTIHQLLTHTSGIPDLPDSLFNAPPKRLDGYLPYFANARLEFEPGADRSYSNAGFVLLGLVIERVSGKSYEQYVRESVFLPARMKSAGFTPDAESKGSTAIGYTREKRTDPWNSNTSVIAPFGGPHGGALVTANDLLRFFTALRNGKLLKAETAQYVTTARVGENTGYGFGVLPFDTDRLAGHSGGNTGASADAYTYWNSGYTIIVLSNLDPPASHQIAREARRLLEPRFSK